MYREEQRAVIQDAICERLQRDESLREICAVDGMPAQSTIYEWLERDAEFRSRYARARARQADGIVEEFAALERQVLSGEIKPDAAKVVLWSRQWRAAKLLPKVYGDANTTTLELGDTVAKVVREIVRA